MICRNALLAALLVFLRIVIVENPVVTQVAVAVPGEASAATGKSAPLFVALVRDSVFKHFVPQELANVAWAIATTGKSSSPLFVTLARLGGPGRSRPRRVERQTDRV